MSTLADIKDPVEIIIGGLAHKGWTGYSIDSDLITPADAWQVSLSQAEIKVPGQIVPGVSVQVRVGGQTVMTGQLDDRHHRIAKGTHTLELTGRDGAAALLDASAPIFSGQDMSLEQIVAKVVRPFGVINIRIDADSTMTRERVSVEPGESAWEALRRAAEANGLWPWFEPDGTLVVGGPDYSTAPVASLIMRVDGRGNNIAEVSEKRSVVDRHSEVCVLGQAHASGGHEGSNGVKAVVKDDGVGVYRPKIVVDHECVNVDLARAKGHKVIGDGRLKAYELTVLVRGHRVADNGVLWTPGQRVHVAIEQLGVDGVFFLMSRRFTGLPQMTTLHLVEDGAWVVQAKPKKGSKKHKGKKAPVQGKIVDVGAGQ